MDWVTQACWLVDGTTTGARGPLVSPNTVSSCAEDALGCCAVVFNGDSHETSSTGRSRVRYCTNKEGVFVVVLPSEGLRFPTGQSNDIATLRHFIPSWIRDEYVAARYR